MWIEVINGDIENNICKKIVIWCLIKLLFRWIIKFELWNKRRCLIWEYVF